MTEGFVTRIGFKPMTPNLEGLCSIQLSYRAFLEAAKIGVLCFQQKRNSLFLLLICQMALALQANRQTILYVYMERLVFPFYYACVDECRLFPICTSRYD